MEHDDATILEFAMSNLDSNCVTIGEAINAHPVYVNLLVLANVEWLKKEVL